MEYLPPSLAPAAVPVAIQARRAQQLMNVAVSNVPGPASTATSAARR